MKQCLNSMLILLLISTLSVDVDSQETTIQTDYYATFHQGKDYFVKELYGPAQAAMRSFLGEEKPPFLQKHNYYLFEAEQIIAISSLRLNQDEGEKLLEDFIELREPHPTVDDAAIALGDYYYNRKSYDRSIYFFKKVNQEQNTDEANASIAFKIGYSYFVQKQFKESEMYLRKAKDYQNDYYYPANYYYGMCKYFSGEYDNAVSSFERVSSSALYAPMIPYYISQIYFVQNQSDKLLSYGERVINTPNIRNRKEIRLLLGQTYFDKGLYTKALPHLEYYEDNTKELTKEEFYQLAFTQYKLEKYAEAIESFRQLALLNSPLGQRVNYYLADCHLRLKQYPSARTAFKKVSQMDYEINITEEALFNYGKLSAELNYDREAVNTLSTITNHSPYYLESRKLISDLLLSSEDFSNSIKILESMEYMDLNLKTTYQKVSFNRALQALNEGNEQETRYFLKKSRIHNIDPTLNSEALFWEAYLANKNENYKESSILFNDYFSESIGLSGFRSESSPIIAHYIQGYNYLKLNNYTSAENSFKTTITEINLLENKNYGGVLESQILPDALVRTADCLFKQNNYESAIIYYTQNIDRNSKDADYSRFQKATILGLQGEPYEKILVLEELLDLYPNSQYADDSYLQLGNTYKNLDNAENAINAFKMLVLNHGDKSELVNEALLNLGLLSFNQGDSQQALAYYKDVIQNQPSPEESQEALLSIKEIYIDDLQDSDGYVAYISTIPGKEISSFSKDSLTYTIAFNQYENGNYEKAINSFTNYLISYQEGYHEKDARFYRGESLSILKNFSKAYEDYRFLVDLGQNSYYLTALRKAALISYNYTQNFSKALKYYKKWAEITGNSDEKHEAHLGALRSAFRINNQEDIIIFGNKIIADESSLDDEKKTAYYYLGKVYLAQGKNDLALESFSALKEGKNNQAAEANYLTALILYQQKELIAAERQINLNIELNATYPFWVAKSILLYADIYLADNDLFNARAATEAVLENFTDNEEIIKDAEAKLLQIQLKEEAANRIKVIDTNRVELDTIGNNE